MSVVQQTVADHFANLPGWRQGDLITRREVDPLLARLKQLGWKNVSRTELTEQLLKGNEPWVAALRTSDGQALMRKVSAEKLVYDRLDRISQMPGGEALVRDLVKLPDADRYVREKRRAGVPGMAEFLPKGGSGKAPKVADYDKPTGRIYTVGDLLESLAKLHAQDKVAAAQATAAK